MSVIALRTRNLNGADDIVATANLRNLQLLLNAAKHSAEHNGSGAVYGNLAILALVIINAAISDQVHDQDTYGLANQAATIVLSVSESLGVPTPNLGLLTEQETRHLESLRIQIQDIERCLTTALPVLLGTTGASSKAAFFESKGKRSGVRRVSSQLQRAFDAFSLKLSILGSSQALHSRRMLHGVDADADVFTWQQVDLQSECEIPMTFFPVNEQFWGSTYEGVIDGTKTVVKTYPGREFEAFRKDLEIMRTSPWAHIRGGGILPLRRESAMTTHELRQKDFHLVVAPNRNGTAAGSLYVDDGVSIEQPKKLDVAFTFATHELKAQGKFDYDVGVKVTTVSFLGVKAKPAGVSVSGGGRMKGFNYDPSRQVVVVEVDILLKGGFSVKMK